MTPLTADAYAVALGALMAMLLSHTTLKLALQVSSVRLGNGAGTLLLSSLALGFGLWTTTFVRILALSGGQPPRLGAPWLLLSLAIAVSCEASALFFVACREPDSSSIAGTAFALTVGVGATRCVALDEVSAETMLHDSLAWACIWFPLTFLTFLGALRIWFDYRDRSWRSIAMRYAGTLAGALGIFGNDTPALAGSRWIFDPRFGSMAAPASLLAIMSAALGCAVLAVLSAMGAYGTER